jgi:hypothetical protein
VGGVEYNVGIEGEQRRDGGKGNNAVELSQWRAESAGGAATELKSPRTARLVLHAAPAWLDRHATVTSPPFSGSASIS